MGRNNSVVKAKKGGDEGEWQMGVIGEICNNVNI